MAFYTFILDYEGGTYALQVYAETDQEACAEWAQNLDVSEIPDFGIEGKEILINELKAEDFEPVQNLKSAWRNSLLIRNKPALIHFLKEGILLKKE